MLIFSTKHLAEKKGGSKILKVTYFGEEELKELLNVPEVPKDMIPDPAGPVKTIRFLLDEDDDKKRSQEVIKALYKDEQNRY